ncbi:alpha-amylase family glycosyl hydrolase [Oceanivirga miroungae]|uniref:Alpha amylase n=1 Tax=Oceanivirga miroungae TaxID=1130046 RepID=A0A6I8MAK5_9FUSO|nr:alpha-amylase family glycosyl hydrolase [Oceanivirga miroungae]VWL85812.1 alpha amylase [Oceanivirga miroungae]
MKDNIIKLEIFKNLEIFKTVDIVNKNGKYSYIMTNVKKGSYSFKVNGKCVTYTHTVPFVKVFNAYIDENEKDAKIISGFQEGKDIVITIQDNEFILEKAELYRLKNEYKDKIDVKIAANFNNWIAEEFFLEDNNFLLNLKEGYYEYKFVVNGEFEKGDNRRLIIGETGKLYEKASIDDGKFVVEALKCEINKINNYQYEFTIRTQINDIKRAFISIKLNDSEYELVKELERYTNTQNEFDYFKRIITFDEKIKEFSLLYILKDANKKLYYNGKEYSFENDIKRYIVNEDNNLEIFDIPDWSKEAIWYNIFPDRFYNANRYNDPIFNEFGPENFKMNELSETRFIDTNKWGDNNLQEFNNNRWTSDFSSQVRWEIEYEKGLNYSLKYARMYGGDLQGIKEKIPYLVELGINAVWLNPVFYSFQNHKYGANDFRHISPDLGTIRTSGSKHGVYTSENVKTYIDVLGKNAKNSSELELLEVNLVGENKGKNGFMETADPSTWVFTESDLIMVDLIKEFHKNNIRVIFDGVFNHSSERHWSFNMVLADGENSIYKDWYKFTDFSKHKKIDESMSKKEILDTIKYNRDNLSYISWAGIKTLPEFNSFNEDYKSYIFNVCRKWLLGPDNKVSKDIKDDDGIDGFRLDVPNCLENQDFWIEFRDVLKKTKKDSYITAEIWGNGSMDINKGNKFDALMNYEWLKTVIGYFINQKKEYGNRYKLSSQDFFNELREKRSWYPYQALQAMQNLNGSHDTDRLYSRIVNDMLGRNLEEGKQLEKGYNGIRPDLASSYHPNTSIDWINSKVKPIDVLKLISVFQMTYIGAPMIYYGDELAMWGATDPWCRKPMLWDEYMFDDEKNPSIVNHGEVYKQEANLSLFTWYKKIISIRKKNKTLIYGRFYEVLADNEKDVVIYERYDKNYSYIIILNNSFNSNEISFYSYNKNKEYLDLLSKKKIKSNKDGKIEVSLKAKKAMILKLKKGEINDR